MIERTQHIEQVNIMGGRLVREAKVGLAQVPAAIRLHCRLRQISKSDGSGRASSPRAPPPLVAFLPPDWFFNTGVPAAG